MTVVHSTRKPARPPMLTGLATTGKPCGDEQHGLVPEAALVVVDPIEVATTRLIP